MNYAKLMTEFFNALPTKYEKQYLAVGVGHMQNHLKNGGKDNDEKGLKIFLDFFRQYKLVKAKVQGVEIYASELCAITVEEYYETASEWLRGLSIERVV